MTENSPLDMAALIARLYPICRSITGDGVRETLRILQEHIALVMHEVATGTQVFDWTVPKEWNIREAWIKDATGRKLVDFDVLNLHALSYSTPIRARMSFAELRQHLFTLPDRLYLFFSLRYDFSTELSAALSSIERLVNRPKESTR